MSNGFNVQQTNLENGFKILTLNLSHVESVASGLFVKAGSRFEDESNNGISHFLEHLAFKGSEKYPTQLEIAKTIESLGGVLNAYTSEDHTAYWNKIPSRHWEKGLDVLLDSVFNPVLLEEGIEKERGVILQEIAHRNDTPQIRVWEVFHQTVWPDDCLGRPVIGTPQVVNSVGRSDFVTYRERFYYPNNMVLVSAGKLNHDEVVAYAKSFLKDFEPKKTPQIETVEEQSAVQVGVEKKDIEQVHLVLGCQGHSIFSPQRYALGVLSSVLGAGMSSRLFEEVREKAGLAYTVRSSIDLFEDTGYLSVYAGVSPDKLELTLKKVIEELTRVKQEKVLEEELSAAKEKVCGPLTFKLETTGGWIAFLGPKMLLEGKVETLPEVIDNFMQVSAKEVQDVANELFVNRLVANLL